jgi:hypothetical protein
MFPGFKFMNVHKVIFPFRKEIFTDYNYSATQVGVWISSRAAIIAV